jgi:hypothetical protein
VDQPSCREVDEKGFWRQKAWWWKCQFDHQLLLSLEELEQVVARNKAETDATNTTE